MNSFGQSAGRQFILCDPRSVRADRLRFRRDKVALLDRANSLYIPAGRQPVRGWVLLPKYEYDQLDKYSTSFQLNIGDPTQPNNVGTIRNLSIVQAQCVTRGMDSSDIDSDNAIYLIELTDVRGVMCNQWFQFPIVAAYNVRAPAYPEVFYPATMNGGTTWTWPTMLQNLWELMPLLGTWPGLPAVVTPAGTPEGFWFTGVSAWAALCDVLDHLGLVVACDLTKISPYTIVSDGADDSVFTALQTRYATNLEDDLEWIDVGAGRVPATVKVLFKRRNSVYGTEETVRYGSTQWSTNAVYTVSVSAPSTFAGAAGTHYLWSDFTVRYDMNGNPLSADTAIATAIAQERVTQYFDRIYSRTSGYMSQTYAGALPFVTGSQVDMVSWSQDYRDQSRQGWKTKIMRGSVGVIPQEEGGQG